MLTTFVGEPAVKDILRLSHSGQVADLLQIAPLYGQWAAGHWLQLGFQVVVLVCLVLAAQQPERDAREMPSASALTPQHRTLLVFGMLAEKIGRRLVGVVCYVGLAAAAWLYYASPGLWFAFAALVFLDAGCAVALNALGTELFPTELRSTAKSWITTATVIGAVAGMAAVGLFAALAGSVDRVICLLSLLPVVASATLGLLPETRGLDLEEIVGAALMSTSRPL